ncbi:hypothetical protein DFJ63DRAFT_336267 [Scheffersomyces coipomensis]|uniref:uncharacterized protein n=1 Tax=Scheffersomyces coipomensis TaxID=1788519 RepID=UPI00315DB7F3
MADEKYQSNYPNSHYLANINNPHSTNQKIQLNRLPTLGEILANKTKKPVDLYTFYTFMRDVENQSDYLDFWFDLINHLNLCKHYVKGLRDSIVRHSTYNNTTGTTDQYNTTTNTTNQNKTVRDSFPISEKSKHKSLSSSILLDLILSDNILEDNDSNRLSQFLRGDINLDNVDPKLRDLIYQYEQQQQQQDQQQHHQRHSSGEISISKRSTPNLNRSNSSLKFAHSPKIPFAPPISPTTDKRISSQSGLLQDEDAGNDSSHSLLENQLDIGEADRAMSPTKYISLQANQAFGIDDESSSHNQPHNRTSVINPSLLERLIKESPASTANNSFITRDNLKESTHNLLLKYFVEDSEKNLNLPDHLNNFIIKSIEHDGRDDPDIFNNVKNYIFNKIENENLPKFLNFMAIRNINHSNLVRIFLGFFLLFGAFWIGYIFLFLNYRKSIRPVIIVPFFIAFYCLISSIYLIDPILVWLGYSESFSKSSNRALIKIEENFIYKLLTKRSLWVLFLILLFTGIFTILFSLVPGHRL